ncbi:hypothetical protein [Comamonas sp. GB3 AK4-5]|uniref:hypothetical protein n=1 Tax=Comamonas sp. GB3 AK4-5 TaxID=3231487 RepID=UPI00351DCBA9
MNWTHQTSAYRAGLRAAAWLCWGCALGVAGGAAAGTPQPHAAPQPASVRSVPVVAEPAPPMPSVTALQQQITNRLAAPDCKGLLPQPAALVALQQLLRPQGLGIRVLGCPMAPAPWSRRVLAVTAVVLDGDKAQDTVRGALADGEEVDMGGDYRPTPWPQRGHPDADEVLDDDAVSPDVQFNRRWLRSVLASQGFVALKGPWWGFMESRP